MTSNLKFIETGNGYLQVFEEGEEFEYNNTLVGKQIFEIDYNVNEEYLSLLNCTKPNRVIYYIDTNNLNIGKLIRKIQAKNSYEELMELIKQLKGYTTDYNKFGKEIRTYL